MSVPKRDPNPPVKLYYRIGEVAQLVGVQPHVLRYWESEFGAIRPQKSPRGQRVYSHKDLERLLRVKELLHSEGYTIAGARKKLRERATDPVADSGPQPGSGNGSSSEVIGQVRDELLTLRAELQEELDSISSDS